MPIHKHIPCPHTEPTLIRRRAAVSRNDACIVGPLRAGLLMLEEIELSGATYLPATCKPLPTRSAYHPATCHSHEHVCHAAHGCVLEHQNSAALGTWVVGWLLGLMNVELAFYR